MFDLTAKLPRVDLDELIELGDVDELVREIDRLCSRRDWPGLVRLRDRSRAAVARGKQLWPAAAHAEYRLALEAPGRWSALVLQDEGAGRFTLGPLPEVAASTHPWSELGPHLDGGPMSAAVAQERVVRGEDLSRLSPPPVGVFDPLPLTLMPWEATYSPATYTPDRLHAPMPAVPELAPAAGAVALDALPPSPETRALVQLADAWVTGSNGRATAVAVEGRAIDAVAALGVPAPRIRIAQVTPGEALAFMAWTAASGGAHARRRGMAAGRFDAWWTAATLAGLGDDWTAAELGPAVEELRWNVWAAGEPDTGWWFRLAVDDPEHGLGWAISAVDAA